MRLVLRRYYTLIQSFLRRCTFAFFIAPISKFKPKLLFAFNSESVHDGFGAQFHRICSIIHAATLLNAQMIRPQIKEITIHPLDGFNAISSMKRYLEVTNQELFNSPKFLDCAPQENNVNFKYVLLTSLSFFDCLKILVTATLSRRRILVTLSDAHPIADIFTQRYQRNLLPFFPGLLERQVPAKPNIVVHMRQGHGGFAIYPGQTISRELPVEHFIKIIHNILQTIEGKNYSLTIFTDAPKLDVSFYPPIQQKYLWAGMPGFDGEKVTHKGRDLDSLFQKHFFDHFFSLKIDRATDPYTMLKFMINTDFLLVSRSSLSFIAGILNSKGIIFAPPNFWHTCPKNWIRVK